MIPSLQNGANDIQNFDKEFTEAEPALTPVEESIVNELNHDLFAGFDYTNPNMTNWSWRMFVAIIVAIIAAIDCVSINCGHWFWPLIVAIDPKGLDNRPTKLNSFR